MAAWLELSVEADTEAVEAVSEILGRVAPGGTSVEPGFELVDEGLGARIDPTRPAIVRAYVPASDPAAVERGRRRGDTGPRPPPGVRPAADRRADDALRRRGRLGRGVEGALPGAPRRPAARDPADAGAGTARAPDDVVLALDPGMAFGTGLHPTTRLCLAGARGLADRGAARGRARPRRRLRLGDPGDRRRSGSVPRGARRRHRSDRDRGDDRECAPQPDCAADPRPRGQPADAARGHSTSCWRTSSPSLLIGLAADLRGRAARRAGRCSRPGIFIDREAEVRDAFERAGLRVTSRSAEGDWVALEAVRAGLIRERPTYNRDQMPDPRLPVILVVHIDAGDRRCSCRRSCCRSRCARGGRRRRTRQPRRAVPAVDAGARDGRHRPRAGADRPRAGRDPGLGAPPAAVAARRPRRSTSRTSASAFFIQRPSLRRLVGIRAAATTRSGRSARSASATSRTLMAGARRDDRVPDEHEAGALVTDRGGAGPADPDRGDRQPRLQGQPVRDGSGGPAAAGAGRRGRRRRQPADLVLVNTCTVTAEADAKSRARGAARAPGEPGRGDRRHRLLGPDRARRVRGARPRGAARRQPCQGRTARRARDCSSAIAGRTRSPRGRSRAPCRRCPASSWRRTADGATSSSGPARSSRSRTAARSSAPTASSRPPAAPNEPPPRDRARGRAAGACRRPPRDRAHRHQHRDVRRRLVGARSARSHRAAR